MTTTIDEAAVIEAESFRRLRATHDPALRTQLTEQWLWLVRYLVSSRRYHAPGWEYCDFVSEGTIGLMSAIDAYDPDGKHSGLRFHTVADYAIRGHLREAILHDIADQPTVPLRVFEMEAITAPAWLNSRETRPLEAIVAPGPSVEEQVIAAVDGMQISATLEAALLLLDERQQFIIERRFGLLADGQVWTCEQIGMAIGRHKSNVSRSAQKALAALRAHLSQTPDGVVILRQLHEAGTRQRVKTRAAA